MDLTVAAVCAGLAIASFLFREQLGIFVSLVLGVATLVQLFRVIFLRGATGALKKLWKELLNALSGL